MTVVSIDFRASTGPEGEEREPIGALLGKHIGRTLGHLDRVRVEDLVDQALRARPDYHELDYHELEAARLWTTSLVESVLDEARKTLRMRMALDVASNLLPRLTPKEHE